MISIPSGDLLHQFSWHKTPHEGVKALKFSSDCFPIMGVNEVILYGGEHYDKLLKKFVQEKVDGFNIIGGYLLLYKFSEVMSIEESFGVVNFYHL